MISWTMLSYKNPIRFRKLFIATSRLNIPRRDLKENQRICITLIRTYLSFTRGPRLPFRKAIRSEKMSRRRSLSCFAIITQGKVIIIRNYIFKKNENDLVQSVGYHRF